MGRETTLSALRVERRRSISATAEYILEHASLNREAHGPASDSGWKPLTDLSVLTPSLNYARFIEDAILSVLRQRNLSIQHVIQDAQSSDGSLEVFSRFDDHIDWRSEPDQGQSEALNKALSRATGRWIAWLNADEFYLPGSLLRLVEVGERSGADVVYGECVIVDEAGRLLRLLPEHRFNLRILREYGCYISSNSTIFRRSALRDGPWGEGIRRIMDWDLYMKLAAADAHFTFVPHPVGAFRVHDEQVTASAPDDFDRENAVVSASHGRPRDAVVRWRASRVGRWMHPLYKLLDGAYVRQWRAEALKGTDLRWFRQEVGERPMHLLLKSSYGLRE
jgi:glycosyltransferase involved in cell wall biosynthesis